MIREITKNDENIFIQLAKEFYSSSAVSHSVPLEYHKITFDELMRSSDYAQAFIIEHEGEIVGYALIAKTFSQEAGGAVVWLEELYIKEQFRSKGLGKQYFDYIKTNIEPNVKRIRLEVEKDNVRAKKLYKNMGFDFLEYEQMIKEDTQL